MRICASCSERATVGIYCKDCVRIPVLTPQYRKTGETRGKYYKKNPPKKYLLDGDERWREISREFLKQNPICDRCILAKLTIPSEHTDHIIPVRIKPDWKYEQSNLQALCHSCHSHKTGAERRLIAYDYRRQKQYSLAPKATK